MLRRSCSTTATAIMQHTRSLLGWEAIEKIMTSTPTTTPQTLTAYSGSCFFLRRDSRNQSRYHGAVRIGECNLRGGEIHGDIENEENLFGNYIRRFFSGLHCLHQWNQVSFLASHDSYIRFATKSGLLTSNFRTVKKVSYSKFNCIYCICHSRCACLAC